MRRLAGVKNRPRGSKTDFSSWVRNGPKRVPEGFSSLFGAKTAPKKFPPPPSRPWLSSVRVAKWPKSPLFGVPWGRGIFGGFGQEGRLTNRKFFLRLSLQKFETLN